MENEVMILIRFWCKTIFKELHSSLKVFKTYSFFKWKTFIATIMPSFKIPLYTDPKVSFPNKLASINPLVSLESSWYDILSCSNLWETTRGKSKFCRWKFPLERNHKSRQHNIKPIPPKIGNNTFLKTSKWLLGAGHAGKENTCGQ